MAKINNEIKWLWLKSEPEKWSRVPHQTRAVIYGLEFDGDIEELIIPEEIAGLPVSIGKEAFASISTPKIGTIIVPGGVKLLHHAFAKAKAHTVALAKEITEIPEGCFADSYVKNIIFEDSASVTTIGERAFERCKCLREFTWPENVKKIPMECFRDSALERLRNCENVEYVSKCAFSRSELSTFPDFSNCKQFEKLAFFGLKNINFKEIEEEYTDVWSKADMKKLFFSSYDLIRLCDLSDEEVKAYV